MLHTAVPRAPVLCALQILNPPPPTFSPPPPSKASIGDMAALALAACLPGLRSLSLRECPRLGCPGWLALASLTALTQLDVRRWWVVGKGGKGGAAHAHGHGRRCHAMRYCVRQAFL